MKVINILTATLIGVTVAQANNDMKLFTEFGTNYTTAENSKVFNVEPLVNIVGGNAESYTAKFGVAKNNMAAYTYATYFNTEKKYNELTIGVGAKMYSDPFFNFVKIYGDFSAGLGSQKNKGKKLNLSSNVTNLNAAMHSYSTGNYTGYFTTDTKLIEFNIGVGMQFKTFVKDLYINTDYSYQHKEYLFQYRIVGTTSFMDTNAVQDAYKASVSLEYQF